VYISNELRQNHRNNNNSEAEPKNGSFWAGMADTTILLNGFSILGDANTNVSQNNGGNLNSTMAPLCLKAMTSS